MTAEAHLVHELTASHPEEAARLLEREGSDAAAAFLAELVPPLTAAVLRHMEPVAAAALLAALPATEVPALLAALPPAAGAALLRRLDATTREGRLALLPPSPRTEALRQLVAHRPGTAGALLDPLAPVVHEAAPVAVVLDRVRRSTARGFDCVFVVGPEQRLSGVLAFDVLLAAAPESTVAEVMERAPASLAPNAGAAAIVSHPGWRRARALPVVDAEGRFLGAVAYATARHLEGELRRAGRGADPAVTARSLGELYGLALGGVAAWAAAAVRGPGDEGGPQR